MPRIAVVDNDQAILQLLADLFEDQGWDILAHSEGRTAYEVLRREQPDLILLDLYLETASSGWLVLQELRQDPATRSIPIIIWSGAEEGVRDKLVWLSELGIPILQKPFNIDDLYRCIETALEKGPLADHGPVRHPEGEERVRPSS